VYPSRISVSTFACSPSTFPLFLRLSDILINHYCPTPSNFSLQDFPSMSSLGAKERVAQLKKRLLSWDFHPHDLCEEDLMRCVVIVIQEVMKLDGLGDLNIPERKLSSLYCPFANWHVMTRV